MNKSLFVLIFVISLFSKTIPAHSEGLSFQTYMEKGDSFNDNGQTELAHKNYLEAYEVAKTKEQKKAVLGSLAVTSLKEEQAGKSLQYLQELLTIFPNNKWAVDFIKKNNFDMSVATVYMDLMLLVESSANTINKYQSFLTKYDFGKHKEEVGLQIFSKDFYYSEDSPSPDDVIMLFFDKRQLVAIFSIVSGLPTDNFAEASDELKYGQLVLLTTKKSTNKIIELYVKDWQSTAF